MHNKLKQMEANFVKKIGEFTPEFLDGISKVFSANATLHIKVEYGIETAKVKPTATVKKTKAKKLVSPAAETPKKRGRKAGFKPKAAVTETPVEASTDGVSSTPEAAPKKRGRQPGFKPKPKVAIAGEAPKKRGPKPKVAVES